MSAIANDTTPLASAPAASPTGAAGQGERRLLAKAQVAARLGCSERSLERLVKQGEFPAPKRFGREVFWFESVVEHVLALAEQAQMQWTPAVPKPSPVAVETADHPVGPTVSSAIPDARELGLEPESQPRPARKAAGTAKRRQPAGATASDIAALGLALQRPTV